MPPIFYGVIFLTKTVPMPPVYILPKSQTKITPNCHEIFILYIAQIT